MFWYWLRNLEVRLHVLVGWHGFLTIGIMPFCWQWRVRRLTEEMYGITGLNIKLGPVVIDIVK